MHAVVAAAADCADVATAKDEARRGRLEESGIGEGRGVKRRVTDEAAVEADPISATFEHNHSRTVEA